MTDFGQNLQRTTILKELSGGNVELGEAFAMILNNMVMQSGITNPKAEQFDLAPKSWHALVKKENKTKEEIEEIDKIFRNEINSLAQSYLLFIARETKNLTGKIDYAQYEAFMLKYRFGHYDVMNKPEYLSKVKVQIRNAFNKISSHAEANGDNLIDKHDMAAYIYAMATKSTRDKNNKFIGFEINGIITPEEYAVNENCLFQPDENLFSIKLQIAYKVLNNQL